MIQTTEKHQPFLVHIPGKKNIQADALSRRPDLCPEETDNENMVVLPEQLFANLIDTKLQRRIVNTENMDYDAAEAIKGLLGEGPNEAKKDLVKSRRVRREEHTVLQGKELYYKRWGTST